MLNLPHFLLFLRMWTPGFLIMILGHSLSLWFLNSSVVFFFPNRAVRLMKTMLSSLLAFCLASYPPILCNLVIQKMISYSLVHLSFRNSCFIVYTKFHKIIACTIKHILLECCNFPYLSIQNEMSLYSLLSLETK